MFIVLEAANERSTESEDLQKARIYRKRAALTFVLFSA